MAQQRPDITIVAIVDKGFTESKGANVTFDDFKNGKTKPYELVMIAPLCRVKEIYEDLTFVPSEKLSVSMIGDCSFHESFGTTSVEQFHSEAAKVRELLTDRSKPRWDLLVSSIRAKNMLPLYENYFSRFADCSFNVSHYLEYITLNEGDIIIEGGVFDAFTTRAFALGVGATGAVYGFDPLGAKYAAERLKDIPKTAAPIELVPSALWSTKTTLEFSDNGSGTRVGEDNRGGISVDATSIDIFVKERKLPRVDFIKFDVEGAEHHALEGARETIMRHRPKIALSVYHGLRQYFTLPLLAADICKNYQFDLNFYSPDGLETVLYCNSL
jgi:FkbM family methyltransferase